MRKPFCHVNVSKPVVIKITDIWCHSRKFSVITRLHWTVSLHSFFSKVSSVINIQVMSCITDCCHIKVQVSILINVSPDRAIGEGTGSNARVFGDVSECSVSWNKGKSGRFKISVMQNTNNVRIRKDIYIRIHGRQPRSQDLSSLPPLERGCTGGGNGWWCHKWLMMVCVLLKWKWKSKVIRVSFWFCFAALCDWLKKLASFLNQSEVYPRSIFPCLATVAIAFFSWNPKPEAFLNLGPRPTLILDKWNPWVKQWSPRAPIFPSRKSEAQEP